MLCQSQETHQSGGRWDGLKARQIPQNKGGARLAVDGVWFRIDTCGESTLISLSLWLIEGVQKDVITECSHWPVHPPSLML
jgi:hypothetical protein